MFWRFLHFIDDVARELEHPLIVVLLTGLIVVAWIGAVLYIELAWQGYIALR